MRGVYGASVLAELAVNEIRLGRELHHKDKATGQFAPRRMCHIIDSIKNQQELELLRTVYGVVTRRGASAQPPRAPPARERLGR